LIFIFYFVKSKLAQYFEYMDEIVFFKHQIKYMETIAPPHEPKGNVSIIDDFAEDIKIRIFYKTEKENSILPAFIYYHGGGYALDYGS
jgi:acetyl esterase/lipase